jgi:alkyldihydroxyacetonephosphate synthase
VSPRESTGVDPRLWLFGSEGRLGIITTAIVKLFPLPEVQRYGSILFPDFESGVAFMYELAQHGDWPASVRLVDNLQFQFGMALKPKSEGWRARKSAIEKFFVTKVKGFEPDKMVACTLVFEGTADEVSRQESAVYRIAGSHGGMKAGAENGLRGYQLTYGIAYIRDFVMDHFILAESFETSAPWSCVSAVCENVKERVRQEHAARNLPGKPFVTCRVTQIYETGAAVYFYFGMSHEGVEHPSEVYAEIERAAREEILKLGGSLSHHHGIGKLRQRYLSDIYSPTSLAWSRDAKRAFDPQNIFGCDNQHVPAEATANAKSRASQPEAKPEAKMEASK